MSNQLLSRYVEERSALAEHVTQILGRAESEERDLTETDTKALAEAETRMTEIDQQVASLKSVIERQESATDVQHLLAKSAARQTASVQVVNEPAPQLELGSFVESDQYRGWQGHGTSGRFEVDTRPTMLTRAPLAEGSAPGSALLPQVQKVVQPQVEAPRPLLDVIGRLPVSSNAVELVTYGTPAGATGAAVVAELAAKPEAAIATGTNTVSVDTIAYWIQATRQLLQDAPAARALIDDQLRRGLLTKLEAEVSAAVAGATYTKTTGASKQTVLEVARTAMADLQAGGYAPNAILTDPVTAAGFDLYLLQKQIGAGAMFGMPVWGLQVVPVPGLAKTYVGDFRSAVTLLERTGVELFITDSHADTFIKNVFTILAEVRAKAVVTMPSAVRELAITP